MSESDSKRASPAYAPYKTFTNFINGLRENGIPSRIDRSAMPGMSGSAQSALKASFEYLGLINELEEPTQKLHQLVESEEKNRASILKEILREAYPYIMGGSIDLKRATTKQLEEAFRAQNISGSTVVKSIAFFLAAAKDAGIEVSPYIKTPTLQRANGGSKRSSAGAAAENRKADVPAAQNTDPAPPGMKTLRLPLVGKQDVILMLPESFNADDWSFLKPILEAYIGRLLNENSQG